ncbi:GNAT family N-acetyltransferase [Pseudonocardia sp. WMMC193]|uniref:GNAT family N-acetyltransferase n=1 Tax=Pseudonocardia sp. WMMC193 TaxID=2911965 RepID=UPI001F16085B|nr:GNAT family N-acetyltransferase [Pseudonocardia sp. WMMC193]MCF7547546.1 GNAT family N-acetyltransferase [Pseudonocardia sp. WMMC193]
MPDSTTRGGDPGPVIRELGRPGDLGWIIGAHAELYAEEFGWDASFEVFVARIVTDFAEGHTSRERAWIAELAGERVGCVMLVDGAHRPSGVEGEATLRVLLVHPRGRGHGVGRRLVRTCLDFARDRGYRRVTLWTNDILTAAIAIYRDLGFELVGEEPHHSYGQDLVGQYWALDL